MKYVNFVLSLMMMVVTMQTITAQKVLDKAHIHMEITDIQSDNEDLMAMSAMLKGSTTDIYFTPEKSYTKATPEKSYTKANMMGGMSQTVVLIDHKTNENLMLMTMMGQKMKINMSEDELKEMQTGSEDPANVDYKHFKDQTKDILGFNCHKVQVMVEAGEGVNMTLWVTDEIISTAHITNGVQADLLGGFPLMYVFSMGGQLEMTMEATKIEKDFDNDIFKVSTEGFKEMTLSEFMDSMGKMGGM